MANVASAEPGPRKPYPWVLVVSLIAGCIGLAALAIWAGLRLLSMRDRLHALSAAQSQLQAVSMVLGQPETPALGFVGTVNAPHGRIFLNRTGLVFVGAQMPGLPANSTFELWLVPAKGEPRPAGLFRPDQLGNSICATSEQLDIAQIKTAEITVEPRDGSKIPTTKPFLVVPLGATAP